MLCIPTDEAINFQVKSPLTKELDAVYMKALQYAREHDFENKNDVKQMNEYIKTEILPEVAAIIERNTGVKITEFRTPTRPSCYFAIIPKLNTIDNTIKVTSAAYGLAMDQQRKPKTADDLLEIFKAFDLGTGKINLQTKGLQVSAVLFFDPFCAFMPKATIHKTVDEFVPAELTAITLHEVGHVLALVERAADMTFRIEQFKDAVTTFMKTAPMEEKVKFATEFKEVLPEGESKNIITKVTNKLEELINVNASNPNPAAGVVSMALSTAILMLCYPITLILATLDRSLTDKMIDIVVNNPKYKTSDTPGSINNYVRIERYADEYVGRFGYGASLVSGLNKLRSQSICGLIGGPNPAEAAKTSKTAYFMALFMVNTLLPLYSATSFDLHGTDLQRAEAALKDLHVFFKQENLPATAIDYYMGEYQKLLQVIKQMKQTGSIRWVELTTKAFNLLVYVAGPASIWDMIANGRITSECEKMLVDAEKLVKNPMYYTATRLAQLK